MKNIFDAKDEKITEKAFLQSTIISIVSILMCVVMLCSLTYAWFNESVQSSSNSITAGHFTAKVVSVVRTADKQAVSPNDSGIYVLETGEYAITLNVTDETTSRGYCVVTINDTVYCTEAIVNNRTKNEIYNRVSAPFVFRIRVTESSADVKIESRWGIPADPNLRFDGYITIPTTSPAP